MAHLSAEEIRHLGHLARLELTPEEEERYATQLSSVVSFVEKLQAVPTGSEMSGGVSGLKNVLAEDLPRAENDSCAVSTEALLQGAPKQAEGYILVKAVMGEEVSSA